VILIDTDVLLDLALDRAPHSDHAAKLLDRLERAPTAAFIAWHTVSNIFYLLARQRGGPGARDFVEELIHFTHIVPPDTDALRYAIGLPMKDFEDAMQVAAARACGAEHIVTRNVRDYRGSPIPAISPQRAVAELF
jgi:predicted nucleic acid-binding protein